MHAPLKKLYDIAEEQQGFFTARQAVTAGYATKNHHYHVEQKNWIRLARGIYKLAYFPSTPQDEFVLWTLWARTRNDESLAAFSHETALSIYDVSDTMPAKLHMTVPKNFRRMQPIPLILNLHYAALSSEDVVQRQGYKVTSPLRTVLDMANEKSTDLHILGQAIQAFYSQGLLTKKQLQKIVEANPAAVKFILNIEKR